MPRKNIPKSVETKVLTSSRRRCCICYGLLNDFEIKNGQISHLDQNPENIELDNLSWLCFVHHDQYDSRTSQSKNFTINEVKQYREELYEFINKAIKSGMQLPKGNEKPYNNKSNKNKNNLSDDFTFSESATADIDFRLSDRDEVSIIIKKLKSHDYYIQNPAILKLEESDHSEISKDQAFVLGRNIYQSACGGANNSKSFMNYLRSSLTSFPKNISRFMLCGMLFEAYFDSKGEFRKYSIKGQYINKLFEIQTAKPYKQCIAFIKNHLEPYRDYLIATPNDPPIIITLNLKIIKLKSKECYRINELSCGNNNLLKEINDTRKKRSEDIPHQIWPLTFNPFTKTTFLSILSDSWYIPKDQIKLEFNRDYSSYNYFVLPKKTIIVCPYGSY